MRVAAIIVLLLLVVPGAYAASVTGTTKLLGAGSDSVPHCQVQDYDIAASDTISSVNTQVECDLTGSYTVTATGSKPPVSRPASRPLCPSPSARRWP